MEDYQDILNTEEWDEKRSEILERDNFTCARCGDQGGELHVHHKWYKRGVAPWQYPDSCYETLCSECHSEEHGL